MINSITGIMSGYNANTVFISTSGIEWAVEVPLRIIPYLPEMGKEATLYIYLHHREDQMVLYGFSDTEERRLFLELIKISGIGPKQGLKILSTVSAEQFTAFLDSEDAAALSRIPGIGEKTAKKIMLNLRDKLVAKLDASVSSYGDLITALCSMGFEKRKVEAALRIVTADESITGMSQEAREQAVFKQAIIELSQ